MTDPSAPNAPEAAPLPVQKVALIKRIGARVRKWPGKLGSWVATLPRTLRKTWIRLLPLFTERGSTFKVTLIPLLLLSVLVYTRSLWTNYIFDEQEALLANPYVNGDSLKLWEIVERDF